MNILNLEAPYFVPALRRQGHTVVSAGLSETCDIASPYPTSVMTLYKQLQDRGFTPDAVLTADQGNLPLFFDMEELPCPSIFYTIDTFCNPWHVPFGYAFETTLVAQKDFVQLFTQENMDARWMPLFAKEGIDVCTHDPVRDMAQRDIPVAFVGTLKAKNLPEREPFLKAFQALHPLVLHQGAYQEIFNRARIILNTTAASELNFRCFEAMACGAVLLMEQCEHGLADVFEVGTHLLPLYGRSNAVHARAVAKAALASPQNLAQIALQGHDEVHKRHMDTHRAHTIVGIMEELMHTQKHQERLADLRTRRHFVSTAYAILGEELTAPHLRKHAEFYYNIYNNLLKKI